MTSTQPRAKRAPAPDKPRLVRKHELKPLLIERFGTPRLNIRTGIVEMGGKQLTADQIERLYLELCSEVEDWPITPTSHAIWAMAEDNQYDPCLIYLNDLVDYSPLPMEQWQRLDKHLLGIDNIVVAEFLQQFFVGAVARIISPGCEARCSPVLVGPQQRGKTTLGRILFGDDYWVEGLADLSKDSRMRCQTAWGVELSELDGITRRSDIESLKTFLTERSDSFRKPYGKGVDKYPRRFVFWGTSNAEPLKDLSGNSRFLCIGIPDKMLPLDWAIANRNALWARAFEQFRSGFDWCKVSEEQRQQRIDINNEHQQIDPWDEIVTERLDTATSDVVSFAEIYDALELSRDKRRPADSMRIKGLAKKHGWEYGIHRVKGQLQSQRGFKRTN
jgi:predicted P-loop ATPase